ncbi:hypothetical protein AGMMS49992_24800 [Clostridia bacterium]|nr:hypothetical protein AGMMS49992_24800 [Clostridia bacterium]
MDLIVIGGGLTGTVAAVAAARQGLDVLLVEKSGFLGGAAGNNLINPFMPNETTVAEDKERLWLSQGIYREIRETLERMGGAKGPCFHEEYLKLALDRLTREAGVNVLLHATFADARVVNNAVRSIRVVTKSGYLELTADRFIDATGDADVAVAAGCPYHLGREDNLCQPMTLCFRLANVDLAQYQRSHKTITPLYQQFQREGRIKNPREDVLIFSSMIDGVLHFNTTRIVKLNPTDPYDLTRAEMDAREQMFEMFHFLKENIPGFERSEIMVSAPEIGVRESRMIVGEYVLTQDDLVGRTAFPDAIAAGNYDIDIHNPEGTGTSHYYFPAGVWYTIPYRCLIPKGVDNLLVAGRCISSTHEAQASYRVMPIVTCLGEAAGIAMAVAKETGVSTRDVEVGEVQRRLVKAGAFVGL